MRVNEKIKKCVAFIHYKMANGDYKYAGTCLFLSRDKKENKYKYAVTARHVIEGIKNLGLDEVFLRFNAYDGKSYSKDIKIDRWIFPKDDSVDLAIAELYFGNGIEHLYYGESGFLTEEKIKDNEFGCGDEVFITGLFRYHFGKERNLPIVRIGNIAMMPNEKITVKGKQMEAYLIESRSIGGLSGSPVFVNFGPVRMFSGNQVKFAAGEEVHSLLGIVCGHFDSKASEIDYIGTSEDEEKINVGIAIVTPVIKLVEFLESDEIKKLEHHIDTNIANGKK